jgi:anti-sigma regulatory factor (Ser/Thr protein kinase)
LPDLQTAEIGATQGFAAPGGWKAQTLMVEEIDDSSAVHLELDSQPESVALVRAMLCGVSDLLGFDTELLDDLNTTVSEACNNVVRHAYGGGTGPLIVHLEADEECVEVTIRDEGAGFDESTRPNDQTGVGLALIRALADRVELLTEPGAGTEVRVAFNRGIRRKRTRSWREEDRSGHALALDIPGDVVGTLAPVNLLEAVLGRMARLLAARARFSLERFSDLYLLFDQLAFHAARRASSPRMAFALSSQAKRLQLEIGPLGAAADESDPAASAEPPAHLRVLADELTVEPVDDSLVLRVVVGGGATHSGA